MMENLHLNLQRLEVEVTLMEVLVKGMTAQQKVVVLIVVVVAAAAAVVVVDELVVLKVVGMPQKKHCFHFLWEDMGFL